MYINDIMRDVNPISKGSYLLMAYDVIIIHSYNRDVIHNKTYLTKSRQHRYVDSNDLQFVSYYNYNQINDLKVKFSLYTKLTFQR